MEQRNSECSLENLIEPRMQGFRFFQLLSPAQERMEHLAHDRTRSNDCHLHYDVVEVNRFNARQDGLLRSALYLK